MDEKLKSNLTSSKHWLRFLYMVLFAIFLQISIPVMWVLVVIQFLFALITGSDNIALRKVCDSLSTYIYQIIRFLTYNSEEKAFPFGDWPEATVLEESPSTDTAFEPVEDAPDEKKDELQASTVVEESNPAEAEVIIEDEPKEEAEPAPVEENVAKESEESEDSENQKRK